MTERRSDILIRALEPADIPELTEAWNQPNAYAGTLQLPYTPVEKAAVGASPIRLPTQHNLVAVIDGKVIGLLGLHPAQTCRAASTRATSAWPCMTPTRAAAPGPR